MRRKGSQSRCSTLVVLGILTLGACGFEKEQFLGDAALGPNTVGFVSDMSVQDEMSGTIQVLVRLDRPADEPIEVPYRFSGGTADNGPDYTGADGTLSFAMGQMEKSIELSIILDSEDSELNETIEITLDPPVTPGVNLGIKKHTVTINATPLPRVNFTATMSEGDETSSITLQLQLDTAPKLPATVTVAYRAVETTAAIGFDWAMPAMATATFPINSQTQTITVPVMTDVVDEDDESVVIEILNTTNVVKGPDFVRTHVIHDVNDPPTVSITTADASVTEGNGAGTTNVNITIALSGPSGKSITVPVTFGGGTATENTDYTYASKADLVFVPNQNPLMSQTSKTITIQIAKDSISEDPQTVITSLTAAPTNATLAMTGLSQTETINDDDANPTVNFMTANQTVAEGDSGTTTTTYTFQLTGNQSEKSIGFDVLLTGTATIPMDYSTIPAQNMGTVRMTIVPAVAGAVVATTVNLDLVVIGDTVAEGADETIIMDISNNNLMNVQRGSQRTRTHTIDDMDP